MTPAGPNYFELFSLPVSFQVREDILDRKYQKLQATYHPDRYINAEESKRVQAVQTTSLINDAYNTLKSPLKRASYLLELSGVDAEKHNQVHLQEEFLLRQLELREALEVLRGNEDEAGLAALKASTNNETIEALAQFETCYLAGDMEEAKSVYYKLQFLFKLLEEIDTAEERLLDY